MEYIKMFHVTMFNIRNPNKTCAFSVIFLQEMAKHTHKIGVKNLIFFLVEVLSYDTILRLHKFGWNSWENL